MIHVMPQKDMMPQNAQKIVKTFKGANLQKNVKSKEDFSSVASRKNLIFMTVNYYRDPFKINFR